jgi:hypothetical protein
MDFLKNGMNFKEFWTYFTFNDITKHIELVKNPAKVSFVMTGIFSYSMVTV